MATRRVEWPQSGLAIGAVLFCAALTPIAAQAQALAVGDGRALEGDTMMTFVVTVSPAGASTLSVNYITGSRAGSDDLGVMAGEDDYVPVSGTLTFAPGETAKTVSVRVMDDDLAEGDEVFTLRVGWTPPEDERTDYDYWGTGVIVDNEPVPYGCGPGYCRVRFPILEVQDAGTGTWRPGAGSVRVTALYGEPNGWVVEDCGADSCIVWDRIRFSRNLAITSSGRAFSTPRCDPSPGCSCGCGAYSDWYCEEGYVWNDETGTELLTFVDLQRWFEIDLDCEGAPSCGFGMSAWDDQDIRDLPSGCVDIPHDMAFDLHELQRIAQFRYWEDGYRFGPGTLDPEPQVTVSDERSDGERGTVTFTVSLDLASPARTTVDYTTDGGSAVAGADYVETSGTLVFELGELSKTVTVTIVEDALPEDDETFDLVLSNPVGASVARAVGTATIEDDDVGPLARIRLADPLVSGCITTTASVWLNEPAPAGGLTVTLHTDNPHVVVPASVSVYQGTLAKRFRIRTSPVAAREAATIEASVAGQVLSAVLTLKPMGPKSLALTPDAVVGGNPTMATVTLQCPAGPGDILVTLSSSQPAVATPTTASVLVPAGTQSVTFDLLTTPVTRVRYPSITATANETRRRTPLTVTP